jgi:hypothetical protein
MSKFPNTQNSIAAILEKAIAADPTNKKNNLKLYKLGYEMYEKANMYAEELIWYGKYAALNGVKDEFYYFKTASIALNAKNGEIAAAAAKDYITAFPDKSRGYIFNVRRIKLICTIFIEGS